MLSDLVLSNQILIRIFCLYGVANSMYTYISFYDIHWLYREAG